MNILFIRKYAWLIVLHGFLNSSLLNRADFVRRIGSVGVVPKDYTRCTDFAIDIENVSINSGAR